MSGSMLLVGGRSLCRLQLGIQLNEFGEDQVQKITTHCGGGERVVHV